MSLGCNAEDGEEINIKVGNLNQLVANAEYTWLTQFALPLVDLDRPPEFCMGVIVISTVDRDLSGDSQWLR